LILKAGLLESRAQRLEPPAAAPVRESTDGGAARPADQGDEAESAGVAERLEIANRAEITEATPLPVSLPQDTQAAAPAPAPLWETPVFRVSPQDGNLRLVLGRWAASSGWTFDAEHWAVDVDIPIVGSASFESGFEEAVQQLLAATE